MPTNTSEIHRNIEQFATQCANSRDCMVDNYCKTILLEAGIREPGQHIKIQKGRHSGFIGTIETINWTEAEVKCKGKGRYFSIFLDRSTFTVLDPSSSVPPAASRLANPLQHALSTALPASNPSPVLGHPTAVPSPEKRPGLSWLPKKKD